MKVNDVIIGESNCITKKEAVKDFARQSYIGCCDPDEVYENKILQPELDGIGQYP